MKTVGIITEYNPLHWGHVHLLHSVRQHYGADTAVVCVMSGDFVQRGDFALVGRRARAEAAVRSGADLVLELPLPWAVSSAEGFARGAMEVLTSTGLLDALAFGSECGSAESLRRVAQTLDAPDFSAALQSQLRRGDSFAAARQRAAAELLSPEDAALLAQPNNTLGVEYIRALGRCGSGAEIFTLPRRGDGHDAPLRDAEGFASGSAIRRLLAEGQRDAALSCMAAAMAEVYRNEESAGRAPVFAGVCQRAMLARLRSMEPADFDRLDTGREGIGRRLYHASREAPSLEGVLAAAKTRRVAYARLRRMVLWAYLGLCPGEVPETVPYLRVLAAGARGRALLHRMRHTAAVPVLTKPADVRALPPAAQTLFGREAAAADLYALAYPDLNAAGGGFLWRQTPVML